MPLIGIFMKAFRSLGGTIGWATLIFGPMLGWFTLRSGDWVGVTRSFRIGRRAETYA